MHGHGQIFRLDLCGQPARNIREVPHRASPLAPFRHGTFRTLWMATLASNLGGLIQAVAAAWFMLVISDSHQMVALVQASSVLPIMLFSLIAGALADSVDRRRIMLAAQVFMLVASVGLTIFAFLGLLSPWLLLSFTFSIGCGTALHMPSWQASMGDIVPREDLPSAVALNSMGFNLMRSVGPAIGGIIVAVAGAATAFAINAGSYLFLIFALLRWQPPGSPRTLPREAIGRAISVGLRYVTMSPNLLKVMLRGLLFGFGAIAVLALLPIVARDLLQGGPLTFGILLGCFGLGAIGGALMNTRLRERFNNEAIVRGASVTFALCALTLALSRDVWLSCAVLLLAGSCWVVSLSLFNVTVQLSTPRWVVGRAMSFYQTATFGGMASGSWIWGMIAESNGADRALMVAAAVLVASALIGLYLSLPEFSVLNLDPHDRFNEPELRLDLTSRSGPIMVMVDYEIAQQDVHDFLAVMTQWRRSRIRDGVQQWVLLRDLENPDIWVESYHVPTWVEYVRHNQRRTKADAEIYARIIALHRGPHRPRVHRMIERPTVPSSDDTPIKTHPEIH